MNKQQLSLWFGVFLLSFFATVATADTFPKIETESFAEEDFVFPDDMNAPVLNVLLLSMSEDQDNGEWQGDQLSQWHAQLTEQGFYTEGMLSYHFAVMKVPFFIKGVVRNAMREDFEGKAPLDRSGVLFTDAKKFAAESGIAMDGQPTIVFLSPDRKILQVFKGEPTVEALAELFAAAEPYRPAGD